jgi:hypothetical protein
MNYQSHYLLGHGNMTEKFVVCLCLWALLTNLPSGHILHFSNKFQELYLPNQAISTGELLILWKDRLSFKQYLPLKVSKFEIKTYKLCDASIRHLWSFLLDRGNDTKLHSPLITDDIINTTAIVLKLVETLLKQGQTAWMDNLYNPLSLAKTLEIVHKTDCVGTLKLTRKIYIYI